MTLSRADLSRAPPPRLLLQWMDIPSILRQDQSIWQQRAYNMRDVAALPRHGVEGPSDIAWSAGIALLAIAKVSH